MAHICRVMWQQAGDIPYVWTRGGWAYPAVILDPHSRRVVGLRDLHANPSLSAISAQ